MKRKTLRTRRENHLPIYLMMLPGLVYLAINNYAPMFGMVMAFKKLNWSKGILGSDWIGFDNFKFLFATKDAWVMTRNTIAYNLAFIVLGTVVGITLAILLSEIRSKVPKQIYQSIILLPYFISMVMVSYLVYAMLSGETGFFNGILRSVGMEPLNWYQEKEYWPLILVIVNLWKTIGFSSIIYYSSITGISEEYYEAARIDGATRWQQIKSITLPILVPTIITLFILNVGKMFYSDFGLFYQVPRDSGTLYPVTQTLDTYVYRGLMKLGNTGMASAAGVYQSVVGFVLVVITNGVVRKVNRESALF